MEAQNIGNTIVKKPEIDTDYLTPNEDIGLVKEFEYSLEFDEAKGYNEKLNIIKKEIERLREDAGPEYLVLVKELEYSSKFNEAKGYKEKVKVFDEKIARLREELGPNYVDEDDFEKNKTK